MTIYTETLDKIVADMERGSLPWRKTWKGSARKGFSYIPSNASTGKPYRGINVFMLWMRSLELGYDNDMRFLTFKQCKDAGGNVKKGEKAAYVMFFKPLEITDKETGDLKKIPLMKTYAVFHVSQCENLGKLEAVTETACELPVDCGDFISMLGMNVRHGGDKPCHIPSAHVVCMPFPQDFEDMDAYRATLYHETIHWMRATEKGSYAFEELVAEFGAAFLCAEFGLEYRLEHVAYLQSWVKMLKDEPKALYRAASAAQKTVDAIRAKILGTEVVEERIAA